jgi:hypothetical protein
VDDLAAADEALELEMGQGRNEYRGDTAVSQVQRKNRQLLAEIKKTSSQT